MKKSHWKTLFIISFFIYFSFFFSFEEEEEEEKNHGSQMIYLWKCLLNVKKFLALVFKLWHLHQLISNLVSKTMQLRVKKNIHLFFSFLLICHALISNNKGGRKLLQHCFNSLFEMSSKIVNEKKPFKTWVKHNFISVFFFRQQMENEQSAINS